MDEKDKKAEKAAAADRLDKAENLVDAIEERVGWCRGLLDKAKGLRGKTVEQIAADIIGKNKDKNVYLRLLCGVTLEPVVIYEMPVLTGNAEKVAGYLHKSARMMGIGLKVAATWNCVAGTARLFGAPVPKVPGAWTDRLEKAQKVVKDLHLTSSAAVAEQEEAADAGMNRKGSRTLLNTLHRSRAKAIHHAGRRSCIRFRTPPRPHGEGWPTPPSTAPEPSAAKNKKPQSKSTSFP